MSKVISKIVVPDSSELTGYALYNVKDANAIPASEKGAASGVATLDNTGKIPSSQIPSGIISLLSDWNQTDSTAGDYIKNKPTSMPASDVSSWAKKSTKPSYTKSEVGLGNVGNFLAVSTEASQGLSETQKTNARSNIGAGTSSFSGSYNDLIDKPTIPSVGNAEIEIQKNGTKVGSFTTNYSGSKVTMNITVPTGTAANKDVPTSGNASTSQVVMGNDSRLTDSRNANDVYSWAKASSKPTYTASEVGAIPTSAKGAASGVAELDTTGKVPTSQLPSYVDDVLEYANKASFPTTGETGKIYVDKATNLTWRWGGSAYVEISPSLALGETSSTAYAGDKGKALADKLATIAEGAEVNVQSDWNATSGDAFIKNKPTIPAAVTESTVSDWGFTKNAGTITGIKMNGSSKGTSGVVDLGTVATNIKAAAGSHINEAGTPSVTASTASGVTTFTFDYLKGVLGPKGDKGDTGSNGSNGTNGTNGVSCTHSWSGTTLTVTSASGTSSANLKGDKGDTGTTPTIAAAAGSNIGTIGTPSVTASTSGTTTTFTFNYLKGAKGDPGQNATTTAVVSTSANGLAPKVTDASKFLKGDGTWATPTNTWNAASSSQAGYVPAATKGKFLHSNASTGNLEWVDDNNTTYSSKSAASGGTAVSLCTTGEKYTWNNKQAALVSGTNIKTINGTSILGSGNIEIQGGGGEIITISLTLNAGSASDLNGATIVVRDNTENVNLLSTTWNGTAIELEVPVPVNYTVTVGSRSGYQTPSAVTYNSRIGRSRNLTFQYKTEVITVTVNTNESGVTAQGQIVTINGVNTTVPASGTVTQKIPFGTTYSVSVNGKSGYNKPANLSYTANSVSRTATMTYTKIVDGVFAVTTTGDLVQYADINTSSPSSYVGVAIKDTSKNMSFFIDKRFPTGSAAATNVGNFKAWSAALYNKDQSYLTNISTGTGDGRSISTAAPAETRTAAFNAYNNGETGIANTTNLVNDSNASSENASNNEAKYCRSIANPVTGSYDGYLASLAEWIVVNDNQVAVNQILNAIGGVAFATTNSGWASGTTTASYYWTSSEYSSGYAWYWYWYSSYSFATFGHGTKFNATQYNCARPFFPLA